MLWESGKGCIEVRRKNTDSRLPLPPYWANMRSKEITAGLFRGRREINIRSEWLYGVNN